MIRTLVVLVALGPLAAFSREQRSATPGRQIAARASQLVGVRDLRSVDGRMPDDCTGLVRLAYESAGIHLMDGAGVRGDNGVTAIYRKARSRGAVHRGRPKPGDLVFFRETYDRNRDGRRNDGLTHVGVVERVEGNGQITIVHRGSKGVARTRMNLRHPKVHRAQRGGAIVNDYLRQASRKQRAYVTGELFAGFASPGPLTRGGTVASRR
ncbi:MAG: CHAP domain-containing protein [Myxococcaceae bacterium]|nr:CHAP domain-containing protein [Myxococcaceae bacterium]